MAETCNHCVEILEDKSRREASRNGRFADGEFHCRYVNSETERDGLAHSLAERHNATWRAGLKVARELRWVEGLRGRMDNHRMSMSIPAKQVRYSAVLLIGDHHGHLRGWADMHRHLPRYLMNAGEVLVDSISFRIVPDSTSTDTPVWGIDNLPRLQVYNPA